MKPKNLTRVCWSLALIGSAILIFLTPGFVTAQERVKFPVGVGTKTLGTGLIWLATKKGFFEAVGLDVQPVLRPKKLSDG